MPKFIRIATDMYPAARIESISSAPGTDTAGESISVTLSGVEGAFDYTGDFARLAVQQLVPEVALRIDGGFIFTRDIEWVNLAAGFDGTDGVEIRVKGDPENQTRQFTGSHAQQAYDQLNRIEPESALPACN